MEFTPAFKQSLVELSPDGQYLASVINETHVVIRESFACQPRKKYTCQARIEAIQWSPDSQYVMCKTKKPEIQIFCIHDANWTCRLDEGNAGIVHAMWPSSSAIHILTFADAQLRMTIWSLVNGTAMHLKFPKFCGSQGVVFSPDGRLVAVLERMDGNDYLGIYATHDWSIISHGLCDSSDLQGLVWSPDSVSVAAWESPVESRMHIFSITGRRLHTYTASEEDVFGIKSVQWSPNGQLMAIASYDQQIQLLNTTTWDLIISYDHPSSVHSDHLVIFKEKDQSENISFDDAQSLYDICQGSLPIPVLKLDNEKGFSRTGISTLLFDPSGELIASISDNMPNVVWIYDVLSLSMMSCVIQRQPLKRIEWEPIRGSSSRLAICCGGQFLYFWSELGCESLRLPMNKFGVFDMKWHSYGDAILLKDKDQFCIGWPIKQS